MKLERDAGLDILLELNGTEYTEESGYWYKIEAWRVEPNSAIPHGVRYNLTLHNRYSKRILGFDNAHAVKSKKHGRYKGRIVEYDHIHETSHDKGIPYAYVNAEKLLFDFFERVNHILESDE